MKLPNTKILLCLILVLAAVLQVAAAVQKSYWEDEAFTATVAQYDLSIIPEKTHIHPPLYFLSAALWGRVFGFQELDLRSLSIVFVLLSIFLAYLLGRELFDENAGLISALLLAFSPLYLTYGHNARYYSMGAFLSLLVVYATHKYQRTKRWYFLLIYVLAGVALVYSVATSLIVILACVIWWLVLWLQDYRKGNKSWGAAGVWILVQGVIALVYFPIAVRMFSLGQDWLDPAKQELNWLVEALKRIAVVGQSFTIGETISPLNPVAWIGVAILILILIYMAINYKQLSRNVWLLLLFLIIVFPPNILYNMISRYPQSAPQALPHRILYIYPFLLIIFAYGISLMSGKIHWLSLAGLLLVFSVGIFNYYTNRQFMTPFLTVPWRTIMQTIETETGADAVIICGRADTVCKFHARRAGFEPASAGSWESIRDANPPNVWWIQTNMGTPFYDIQEENNNLEAMRSKYSVETVYDYGLHDASIRWLKTTLLGQVDYAHRVNVYWFSR